MALHSSTRPQPVLTRAAVVTVLTVLSALLVQLGAGDVSVWLDEHSELIAGVVLAAGPTVSAWLARRHVTPTAAPRANDGTKLVRADKVVTPAPLLDADAALAAADVTASA